MIDTSSIAGNERPSELVDKIEAMRARLAETPGAEGGASAATRLRGRATWAASRLLSRYDRQEAGLISIQQSLARGVGNMLDRAADAVEAGDVHYASIMAQYIRQQDFGRLRDQLLKEPWDAALSDLAGGEKPDVEGLSGLRDGADACRQVASRLIERAAREVRAREPQLADAFLALEQTELDLCREAGLEADFQVDLTEEGRHIAGLKVG